MTDINKKLCQHLGICWHEYPLTGRCACIKCGYSGSDVNPDFTADPLRLLREVKKLKNFDQFIAYLNGFSLDEDGDLINDAIPIGYILYHDGALAQKALEWFEGKEPK